MNEPKPQDMEIERLLRKVHLPEPSSPLHDRVMAAAGQAWDRAQLETPWQIPLRRLVLSAAAAVAAVCLANHLGDVAGPQARPGSRVAESTSDPDVEEMAGMIYGPARNRLGTGRRRTSEIKRGYAPRQDGEHSGRARRDGKQRHPSTTDSRWRKESAAAQPAATWLLLLSVALKGDLR